MSNAINLPEKPAAATDSTASGRKVDRLALLYEGILTAICRVHSGKQSVQDLEVFRGRMKDALSEVASTAARQGYATEDVKASTFAVVAFLDEVVLTAPGTGATNWIGKNLGEELFDERSAGELFFKRLDALRADRDSQNLAEVLEVYYLCLLLGYEGKFAGGARGELHQIMANLRERIERILGQDTGLSPDRALPAEPPAPPIVVDPFNRQLRLFALAALLFALLSYLGFYFQLQGQVTSIQREVEKRLGSGGAQ